MEVLRWKRRTWLLLSLYCLLSTPYFLHAQQVGLTATSERKEIRIAEPLWLKVTARVPSEIDSIGPVQADSTGMFQILGVAKGEEPNTWMFELMTIDTGRVFVAPIAFVYTLKGDTVARKAYSNSVSLSVAGTQVAPDADIKDIKPPMSAPWKWEDIWPYLVGAALLAGGSYAFWQYRKKKLLKELSEPVAALKVEPHVRALRELRILEEKKLWQKGEVKSYYSEATEIVRRFFEARWRIPALEMTTPEIMFAFRDIGEAEPLRATMQSFFTLADMVKFAKANPTPAEHATELEQAFTIVRGMIPAPPPPDAEKIIMKETADVG